MDGFSSNYKFNNPRKHPRTPNTWLTKRTKINNESIEYIKLKQWQNEAFMTLKDSKRGFIKAFCGSGKTIAARSIGAYKVIKYGLIQVYCVPHTDIGNDGFGDFCNIEIPFEGKTKIVKCYSPMNFCRATSWKIKNFIEIMTNEPKVNVDGVSKYQQIVVTHQLLNLAIKHIRKKKNSSELLRKFNSNKSFWIDEGHHIKGAETESEKKTRNLLGNFVEHITENPELNTEIFAMTATPYRADHGCIISEKYVESFDSYSLDFLRHFKTLGIDSVEIKYETYKDKKQLFRSIVSKIVKEIDKKHFVFVPPTGRKWRKNKKDVYLLFNEIYKGIMKKLGVDLQTAKSMVLDLVTEKTQKAYDKLLKQEPKNGQQHTSKFTVVVACMKCREGSDWCPADRLHNTSMERSPPLNFQTNGRLFRKYPGKDNVKIYGYLPDFKTVSKNRRELISDTVNAMLHYMLMDDLLNPIMVEIPCFYQKNNKEKTSTYSKRRKTTLADHFGLNYFKAQEKLLESFGDCDFNDINANKIILKVINDYLPNKQKYNKKQITEIKNAWKIFLLRSTSENMRNKGVDVSYIRKNGFDIIVEKEGLSGNIFTANLTVEEMERFREVSRIGCWDDETMLRKNEYLLKFAEKALGRKVLASSVAEVLWNKNLTKSKNPDYEAMKIIRSEDSSWVKFNNKVIDFKKQKNIFSVSDVATTLKTSEKELVKRISVWAKFLPDNWKGNDLLHKSWDKI